MDYSVHTEANARRVHDALMLLLCFREHPVTRPTCMRLLLVPGVLQACTLCNVPGCLGNAWDGITAIIRHHKTASTYGTHTITVLEGSKTQMVLQEYVSWARPLLVKDSTDYALFLTRYGKGFTRDGCFNKYLPRLLQQVSGAQLSWTKVSWGALRTACGDVSHPCHLPRSCATSRPTAWCHWQLLSSLKALQPACRRGVHAATRTQQRARNAHAATRTRSLINSLHSVRKLTSVYQDNRREFVAKLGLDLYQSAGAAGGDAPGTDSDAEEEEEEEDAFQHGAPPLQLALSVQQQQQLALGPAPAASPAAAGRGMRAPMAHLLSMVPAKRSAGGTMLTTC